MKTELTLGRFETVTDIQISNKLARLYFFEPETMEFFNSQIESAVIGNALFITSEIPRKRDRAVIGWNKRRFTIRAALLGGDIATAGTFGGYATKRAAEKDALRIASDLSLSGRAEVGEKVFTLPARKITA